MQFTSRITEDDFVDACRLQLQSTHRTIASVIAYTAAAIFWLFLLAGWISERLHPADRDFLGQNPAAFRATVLPAAVLLALWILIFRVITPYVARHRYRRAPYLHDEIANEVNLDGLAQKTSSGSFGFIAWKDLSYWRESKQVIIVVYPMKIFCILPKSNLNENEQAQLRSILAAALPSK
jgi:hypothetical protein